MAVAVAVAVAVTRKMSTMVIMMAPPAGHNVVVHIGHHRFFIY